MTKHNLSYKFNMCYHIYLKLTEINGIGMPEASNNALNDLNISARVTAPVYYFTIVLFGKTAVK